MVREGFSRVGSHACAIEVPHAAKGARDERTFWPESGRLRVVDRPVWESCRLGLAMVGLTRAPLGLQAGTSEPIMKVRIGSTLCTKIFRWLNEYGKFFDATS